VFAWKTAATGGARRSEPDRPGIRSSAPTCFWRSGTAACVAGRSTRLGRRSGGLVPAGARVACARRAGRLRDVVLAAPIILPDYPEIAPEAPATCATARDRRAADALR
jgi:hypothetical protein